MTSTPSPAPPAPAGAGAKPGVAASAPPLGVAALVLSAGLVAVVAGLAATGAAAPSLLADPGAVVRWGLPVVSVVADLAGALTVGSLVLTALALPVPHARTRDRIPLAYPPGIRLAWAASVAWALATVARTVLVYADIAGRDLTTPGLGGEILAFVQQIDLGRGLAFTAAVAALVSLMTAGATRLGSAGLLAVVAMIGLIPQALSGHAAGSASHETAVTSLGLHLLGVCVWAGGLLALVMLHARLGPALASAARRYSTLAGWSFALVAVSGVVNAKIRVGDWAGLEGAYGALVIAKVVALLLLGVAGYTQRSRTLPALDAGRPGAFARLALAEVVVMGLAVGVAVALARSAPPVAARPVATPTMVEVVTGYPMPPRPTAHGWLTLWQPDLLWVTVTAGMTGLYLLGVARLHRRGDRWSVGRTLCWLTGVLVVVYMTCGPPAAFGRVAFSLHMVTHMSLSLLAPPLLVLGAPVTLALRALHPRGDGTRGAREWLLAVLESRYLRLLAHPVVAATLFAGSLVIFYYSSLFGLALRTHVGHEVMQVHFLFAGYLFAWVLIGVDPGPPRPGYPMRLVMLFATMAFHAFFGISLISGKTVLQPGYFGALGRPWGGDLLADQQYGGGLAWGLGEAPTLLIAIVLAVQWAMSDDREARRTDRAADRDGDADLKAYNAMLAGLARRDRTIQDRAAGDHAAHDGAGRDSKGT